jgi:hypothetical protein
MHGKHDHSGLVIGTAKAGEKFEAAAAAEIDVENDDGRLFAHVNCKAFFSRSGLGDDAAGQEGEKAPDALADDVVVVDDE